MNKELCKECGSELKPSQEFIGAFICMECRKNVKLLNAINNLTDKVEILIERSRRGNL